MLFLVLGEYDDVIKIEKARFQHINRKDDVQCPLKSGRGISQSDRHTGKLLQALETSKSHHRDVLFSDQGLIVALI